jgi:pyruvate dehydrogenase E2 component (dihydrolipoamide acetyltransferase)
MIEFKLPSLGADMDEGTLLEWRVKPGDSVKRGQVLAVVDTSKAAVDVEVWNDGQVGALRVQPGEKIPVGAVLATLLEPGETAAPSVIAPRLAAVPSTSRHAVSPSARRRALELGIDPEAASGSGVQGSVTRADIETLARARPAPASDHLQAMRQAIAAAMSRSKREIPHYYLSETIPMDAATAWLQRHNAALPITERILPAVLQIKAVALALQRFPELNGFYRDGGFVPAVTVHAGVAISLRGGGLVAPALHDVAAKPLELLMQELADLVKRARAGSLRSSEMSDPSITITNLGEGGAESVFGVIYPPQVALVGFGSMGVRPWVQRGVPRAIPLVTATLAGDHRVSDGHRGALFLAELRDLLQRPDALAHSGPDSSTDTEGSLPWAANAKH